jgi:hypothetical protein
LFAFGIDFRARAIWLIESEGAREEELISLSGAHTYFYMYKLEDK